MAYQAPQYPPPQNSSYYQPQQPYQQQPQQQSQSPYPQQQQQQQPYQMNPSSNYAQQQPIQGKEEYLQDYGNKDQKFDAVKPKFNDIIFAILFLAQLGAFIALSVIALRALPKSAKDSTIFTNNPNLNSTITLNLSTAYLLAIISGAALVFSILLLGLVRAFTTIILEISLLLSVAISVAYAVYLYLQKSYVAAGIFTFFAIVSIIAYFPMRRRIPLSKLLLKFVLKIAGEYKSVYFIALAGAVLQTIYSIYWSFSAAAIYQKYTPGAAGSTVSGGGTPSSGAVIGVMVFALFSYYWTTQFIMNLFLTTEAGIYSSYYFSGPGTPTAAWSSFRRASTYSMGSIAFGSLIIALLDLLRAGLEVLMSYERGEGSVIGTILVCCAQCFVGCLRSAAQYFNRYAMIEIAMYGKPYIKAAKDTWNLFKDRGIDALVNDCLVNNVWTFLSLVSGLLSSGFAFIYLKVANPSYIVNNPQLLQVMIGYGFIIGFFVCHTLGYGALSSGVSTIFVGLAEDPQALAERDPELFEHIRKVYPQVTTSV